MSTRVDEPPSEGRRADLDFYFDPVCPFAWMTSKWVRLVADQRDYEVDWRFISLRMINAHIDYDAHFPPSTKPGTPPA
jgi:2-hydroxychromene-2-carboxylate isomerase